MQIYFIRHGKTEWNLEKKYQGAHGDSPLLPESMIDLKDLTNYLSKNDFSAIYSSPLLRAKLTAETVADALNLPVNIDQRLGEFDLGKLEGETFVDAARKYPTATDDFFNHPEKFDANLIESESYQDVFQRGQAVISEIVNKYSNTNDRIVVVSHGAFLVALIGFLLGYDLENIRQNGGLANTSVTILNFSQNLEHVKLVAWNQTNFLRKKLSDTDII